MNIEYWSPELSKEEKTKVKNLAEKELEKLTERRYFLKAKINNILNDKSILFDIISIEDDKQMVDALVESKNRFTDENLFSRICSSKNPNIIADLINNEFESMNEKIESLEFEISNLDRKN